MLGVIVLSLREWGRRATVTDVFRFLLSRRWALFAVLVVAVGVACWRLGSWQFDRLEQRRADNAVIERNLASPALPVTEVMAVDKPLSEDEQWRRVELRGRYDVADEALVRYQTRDSRPGVSVVTPLLLDSGQVALVDRGWMPASSDASDEVTPPAPPAGEITVTGWARPDQSGDPHEVTPIDGQVRLISSAGFTDVIDAPLLRGFVSAAETVADRRLVATKPPTLDSGPHFFYGLQWWFFAALAIGGFGYFAWAEVRDRRRGG